MNKKSQDNGVIIILLLAIILVIGLFIFYRVYFPTGYSVNNNLKPKLILSGLNYDNDFSLIHGCQTQITGYVYNIGNENANRVIVSCKLTGTGGGITSQTREIGSVWRGTNSYFELTIDNNCPAPERILCTKDCSNC